MVENLTEDNGHTVWDPERWDPDATRCTECQKCGASLEKAGGRSGGMARCPECEVAVQSW